MPPSPDGLGFEVVQEKSPSAPLRGRVSLKGPSRMFS